MAGLEDAGGRVDAGQLAAAFAGLPAALQALQDRAVAEAVAQATGLLRDHYALYHRTTGGGGGGWALLEEIGPLAADTASPLAFSSIPQDCRHLWVHFSGRSASTGLRRLGVQCNADGTTAHYAWTAHYVQPSAVHSQTDAAADNSVIVATLVPSTEPDGALTTADVYLWGYTANDSRYKSVQATAQADDLDTLGDDRPELRQTVGVWRSGSPITAVRVAAFTAGAGFAAGTHVELFGLRA